jgi:hypothetical protein
VVGLSKFNESVQKLKNGQVAGSVSINSCFCSNELIICDQSHCRRFQQGLRIRKLGAVVNVLDADYGDIGGLGAVNPQLDFLLNVVVYMNRSCFSVCWC